MIFLRKSVMIFLRKIVDIFREICIIGKRMDTLIKRDSLGTGDLGSLNGKGLIVGTKQLKKALAKDCVGQIWLARDADPALTLELEAQAARRGVRARWVSSMAQLGRACGIDVGAAAAAIKRE